MTDKLTRKQKKFVKGYVETGNGTQTALEVYDTDDYSTAGNIASENLNKPKIQKAIEDALPDDLLNKVHLEGLFATKTVFKNNNETKQIEAVSEEADFISRAKYLDMAYKRRGLYAPEKSVSVNVNVTEPAPKVKSLAKKLNE